jgi:hypothetical protein
MSRTRTPDRSWAGDFWLHGSGSGDPHQVSVVVVERLCGKVVLADVRAATFVGRQLQRTSFGTSWPKSDPVGYQAIFDIARSEFQERSET